jgi:LAO/AO transport system kinase
LDEVWQAVLDHRAWLEEQGSLEARRRPAAAGLDVGDGGRAPGGCRAAYALGPDASRPDWKRPSARAKLSAVEAADRILAMYAADLRAGP